MPPHYPYYAYSYIHNSPHTNTIQFTLNYSLHPTHIVITLVPYIIYFTPNQIMYPTPQIYNLQDTTIPPSLTSSIPLSLPHSLPLPFPSPLSLSLSLSLFQILIYTFYVYYSGLNHVNRTRQDYIT